MQFEKSFVNNYVYNENNETIVGGYPIQLLHTEEDIDTKFDNMSIPIGLVIEKVTDSMKGGNVNNYSNINHSEMDLIDDNLFDSLINKISYRYPRNTTRKNNKGGYNNITKKSK